MEIYYSNKNFKITFNLVGELDEFCAEEVKNALDKIITDNKPQEIVLRCCLSFYFWIYHKNTANRKSIVSINYLVILPKNQTPFQKEL